MKKLVLFLGIFLLTVSLSAKQYTSTGHDGFQEIDFYDTGNLLINLSSEQISIGTQSVSKAKFWGWKTHYFNYEKKASYVGEILFSKSNKTNTAYQVDYTIESSKTISKSTKTTGSISAKLTAAIKKVTGTISGSYDKEKEVENKIEKNETTKIKINIPPHKKVTLRVTGDAYVTNAISRYYVLGMAFKKGMWETIDVATSYYELCEENYR